VALALLVPKTGEIEATTGMGRVRDVFPRGTDDLIATCCGIGHVRYSTTGSSCVENAAPFVLRPGRKMFFDPVAIAHNGNVVNAAELRAEVTDIVFQSETDSEVIAALLLRTGGETFAHRLRHVAHRLRGAYSLVLMSEGKLYGLRDPYGMRPLSLGRLGDGWILASETCAFDRVGATFERELEPGELVTIDDSGCHSEFFMRRTRRGFCVFEFVYFSDATSVLDGRNVYAVREELGRQLALEHPAEADMVVPVPLTAIPMAIGYAEASGLPFAEPIIASRYADRSFIKPDQRLRRLEIEPQIQYCSRQDCRQAAGGGGRLARAGQHARNPYQSAPAQRRCAGPRSHRRSADPPSMLLRHRHSHRRRTHRPPQLGGAGSAAHRGR